MLGGEGVKTCSLWLVVLVFVFFGFFLVSQSFAQSISDTISLSAEQISDIKDYSEIGENPSDLIADNAGFIILFAFTFLLLGVALAQRK